MPTPDSATRHLRWEDFARSIESGIPRLVPLQGDPRIEIYVEKGGNRIGMRIHRVPEPLVPSPLSEISVSLATLGNEKFVDVSTDNRRLYREFYDFARDVADRIQLSDTEVGDALRHTLQAWSDLMQRLTLMSDEQQSGLIGELWYLNWLAGRLGWSDAVESWKGPDAQEHDFVLPRVDVEVKTTLKERRIHQIGSLTQLKPKAGRPLYLISVQLTSATPDVGFTLPQLVEQTRKAAVGLPSNLRHELDKRIHDYGWVDEHALLYSNHYTHRSEPELIPIDEQFPAITPATLHSLGDKLVRIERLSYGVNVDGLGIECSSPSFASTLILET